MSNIPELKERLCKEGAEPDYKLWLDLLWFSRGRGVGGAVNVTLVGEAMENDAPNLLIPFALSMLPEGWTWRLDALAARAVCALFLLRAPLDPTSTSTKKIFRPTLTKATAEAAYPAAALMLAILETIDD